MKNSDGLTPWPADQIERRPVAELISYARNPRKHSPGQVAEIAGLIREFGWTMPVLIDETGRIIAGHGRTLAAHQLGIADVPVIVARDWSEAQKRAYTIADNQSALNSAWNKELLHVELADLASDGFDLQTIGFDAADEYLAKQHPEEQELYALLERTRARLAVMTVTELLELSSSQERQEILQSLQRGVSGVLEAMERMRDES